MTAVNNTEDPVLHMTASPENWVSLILPMFGSRAGASLATPSSRKSGGDAENCSPSRAKLVVWYLSLEAEGVQHHEGP